jgi:hypothetical protein
MGTLAMTEFNIQDAEAQRIKESEEETEEETFRGGLLD